jgi:hypothetical protein
MTQILALPFKLVAWIIEAFGRLVAVIIGLVLVTVGLALTVTVIGAIIGIPLLLLGFLLVVRGLF